MYVWSYNMLPVCTIITFCFFLLAPKATPLNFSIPRITTQQSNTDQIRIDGDAYIVPDGIQVTRNELGQDRSQSTGRAYYKEHLHLWDKASRNLTDFSTHFSFVIDSERRTVHGDGLAFFLLPSNITGIDSTAGGALGLPVDPVTIVNTSSFVAVEFDTFYNGWDPKTSPVTHVGININSLTSANYSVWYSNITQGGENEAWISYNSSTKTLDVGFTGYINGTRVLQNNLSYVVDLRDCLPEWVTIGFSASTG